MVIVTEFIDHKSSQHQCKSQADRQRGDLDEKNSLVLSRIPDGDLHVETPQHSEKSRLIEFFRPLNVRHTAKTDYIP
jgi:hypothetical protein